MWPLGSAIFDKDSKKAYVNVANFDTASSGGIIDTPFSKDDSVLVIVGGYSFLATVEATEKNGDGAIVSISWDELDYQFWFRNLLDSGSERQNVLIRRVLPNSKQIEKPFATIGLPSSDYTALRELKSEIMSAGGLTFLKAAQMAGLEQFSQVTAKFNAGTPAIMFETFVADKVKAKLYNKGDNDLLEIGEATQRGILASDDQQKQERLDRYLDQMRAALREEDGVAFVHYSVSLVDENLKVVVDSQSVKRVRRTRNGRKITYTLEFSSGVLVSVEGTYTLIIEKKIVKKSDVWEWDGNSGMPGSGLALPLLNQEHGFQFVGFSKKHSDSYGIYLELLDVSKNIFWDATLASFTVDKTTLIGHIRLGEDNKVWLTKPNDMGQLAWDKDLAALQSRGFGFIAQVALGSAATPEMIELRIGLGDLATALDVYKGIKYAQLLTVAQLGPAFNTLKVADALVAPKTAAISVVTATATIAGGAPSGLPQIVLGTAVKWFNAEKCLEITVPIISSDKFTVCDSNGVDPFQEQGVADFLDAAAADIQNERAKELGQYFKLAGGKKIEWEVSLQSTNNRESGWLVLAVNNAEVIRTGSGTRYRFYLEVVARQLPELDLNHGTILQIVRTAEQSNGGSKFVEKFVEDIAQQYANDSAYNIWYLKDDTIIEANAKLTIKAGQQLRLNRPGTNKYPTLTNKGTIILDKSNQLSGSLFVVNVNPDNPLPAFTNGGTITCNGGTIWFDNGMTNNGTITNNGGIVNYGGTFTNNGRIDNNATISNYIRNGASFAGNPVFGRSITNI
jgi:hypothetical protein